MAISIHICKPEPELDPQIAETRKRASEQQNEKGQIVTEKKEPWYRGFFEKEHGVTVEQATERLLAIYDDLNAKTFGNQLPNKREILIDQCPSGATAYLDTDRGVHLPNGKGRVCIVVSPSCDPESYRRVLVHEMTHYLVWGHGPEFRAKFEGFARGEPWLEEELKLCERQNRLERIASEVINPMIKLAREKPSLNWVKARSELARKLGCKVSELREAKKDFKERWNEYVGQGGKERAKRKKPQASRTNGLSKEKKFFGS